MILFAIAGIVCVLTAFYFFFRYFRAIDFGYAIDAEESAKKAFLFLGLGIFLFALTSLF